MRPIKFTRPNGKFVTIWPDKVCRVLESDTPGHSLIVCDDGEGQQEVKGSMEDVVKLCEGPEMAYSPTRGLHEVPR